MNSQLETRSAPFKGFYRLIGGSLPDSSSVLITMSQFGWDPRKYQLLNKLGIIDCYSATAGVTEGVVPQPFDLTNVSIHLTSVMEKMGNHQVTIILDSLMPIFSEAEPKHAVSFIQSIAAKVKKVGGKMIATLSTGSVQPELFHKVESLVDGVVELRMVEEHQVLRRYLLVRKMDRRQIIPRLVRFDILSGIGIQLQLPRFGFLRKRQNMGTMIGT